MVMLLLLGRGQAPEWDDDKHDIDEVFAFMCYRGLHYAKTVYINVSMEGSSWFLSNPRKNDKRSS